MDLTEYAFTNARYWHILPIKQWETTLSPQSTRQQPKEYQKHHTNGKPRYTNTHPKTQPPRIPFNHTKLSNSNYKPKPCPTSTPWATTPTLIPSHPTPKIVPSTTTESDCWKTNRRRKRKRTTPAPTEGAIGWWTRFYYLHNGYTNLLPNDQLTSRSQTGNHHPTKIQPPNMREIQRN